MSNPQRVSSDNNNRTSGENIRSTVQDSSYNNSSKIVSSLQSDSNQSKIGGSDLKLIVSMSEIELLGGKNNVGIKFEPFAVLKVGKQIFKTKRDQKNGLKPFFKESFTFRGFNVYKDKFKVTIYDRKNCPKNEGVFVELKLQDITKTPENSDLHPLFDKESQHAGLLNLTFKTSPDTEPIAEDPREN